MIIFDFVTNPAFNYFCSLYLNITLIVLPILVSISLTRN